MVGSSLHEKPESSADATTKAKGKQMVVNDEKPGNNPLVPSVDVDLAKDVA